VSVTYFFNFDVWRRVELPPKVAEEWPTILALSEQHISNREIGGSGLVAGGAAGVIGGIGSSAGSPQHEFVAGVMPARESNCSR